MWFYKCFSFGYLIFLILVFCEDNMKKHKDNKKQLNAELTLYKKITKTNKKLQELVKNFKQIENTYKHFKTTDSDSSESEIDEVFRKISYNKNKSNKLFQKQTFTTSDPSYHYRGTAYIYENQESSVLGDEDVKDVKKELVNSKEEKTLLEDSLENNAKTEISSEKITASGEVESKTQSDEVVEIKIEDEKNIESLGFKPKKLLKKSKRPSFPNNRQKTRFSVLHSAKNNINVKRNNSEIPFKIGNQRIVYSELFPPETIWHEIINRPIKLNRVIASEETSQLNSRGNKEETAMIRADKTRKQKKEEDTIKILDGLGTQQELSDIAKYGNSTLRDGYGDACIQVPMKKCKKAMKAVNKNVCKRRFKCESEFKSDFDKNLKKECVKKFSYIYSESKETNINRVIKDDNQFLDATRLRPPPTVLSLQNQSRISSIQLSLRDKFEKRCQKESRDKCIAACNDATEETCLKYTCDKKKNKAMTRVCKEECKNIFLINNKSSKSSDDSSDSDSESD